MIGLGLTKQQLQARNFIAQYIKEHGYSPSYQEIAAELRLQSKSGVQRIVDGLIERGHARRMGSQRARSIAILDEGTRQALPINRVPSACILDYLPASLADKFRRHCEAQGDKPHEAIADLVELYLDEIQTRKARS